MLRINLLACLLALSAMAKDADWLPTKGQVAYLESHASLPKGANPLREYERYYFGTWVSGRRTIIGILVATRHKRGAVHIVPYDSIPIIQDGGCMVVRISFDVVTKRQTGAACNGLA